MTRKIVLDIVFKGMSLNYDQGAGNYQELKKITRWDGRQYTLVSRYALRYSLLETLKNMGFDIKLPGDKLTKSGDNNEGALQPDPRVLLDGSIFEHPELDLFGFLITDTEPQNAREACVKISHAISMTPYDYDVQFCANLDLANRYSKSKGEKVEPNPFNIEEHETFYQYTVVIDVDRIGEIDVYLFSEQKDDKKKKLEDIIPENLKLEEIKKGLKNENIKTFQLGNENEDFKVFLSSNEINKNVYKITLKVDPIEEYRKIIIKKILEAIFKLKRSIKAREEDISPKFAIIGLYNGIYDTYKDKIRLIKEFKEEHIIEEEEKDGKKTIKRAVRIYDIPTIEIEGISNENVKTNVEEVIEEVSKWLDKDNNDKSLIIYKNGIEYKLLGESNE